MKTLIDVIKSITNDVITNYTDFNKSKLTEAITKFQVNILYSRKSDSELITILKMLTTKQILDSCLKLNLNLLSVPKPKNKLIPLVNGLLLQNKKKFEFLSLVNSYEFSKRKEAQKKPKSKTVPSTSDYKDLRKSWLTSKDLNSLESKLKEINMNITRAVTKPWGLRPNGRTKIALIIEVINYVKKMRRLSKLGT